MTLAIAVEGGLAVVAILVGRFFGRPPLETLSLDTRALVLGLLSTLPLLVAFFALLHWPLRWLDPIRRFSLDVLCPALAPCTVPDLAAIALLAGFGEEMLFRGALQALFTNAAGQWAGLAAASLLFGVLHAVTPAYAVVAAIIGAYLGWLWQVSGNILTPIIVHALYDFVVLVYLLAGPGRSLWEKQVAEGVLPEESDPGQDPTDPRADHFAAPPVAI
jgi:membrane protease YdiL (CAAX protease family)